jgi:hypothetical protein
MTFRERISRVLGQNPYPVTVRSVQRGLAEMYAYSASWHTIKKYLEELVLEGAAFRQSLPTESKHKPLVLYLMRGSKAQ